MALSASQHSIASPVNDNASDYGSDLDLQDETIYGLLSQAESQPLKVAVRESIEDIPQEYEPLQERIQLRVERLQQSIESVRESSSKIEAIISTRQVREPAVEVEYDEDNRTTFSPIRHENEWEESAPPEQPDQNDTRTPLQRFRTRPKKPLSVTDLVSPAWCEQQYWYNLTRYGRKPATQAMKAGSKVHAKLEREDHILVPVETVSAEDKFGLRLWNSIESLRRLRRTGMTREMEIYGVLEGEVVIGIIDEVSTTCPDEIMEASLLGESVEGKNGSGRKTEQLDPNQRTLKDFLTGSHNGSILESSPAFLGTLHDETPRRYYLKDVKTRQSRTLPALGSATRPTHMQLMLYYRMLSSLAANEVPADTIFDRYRLDPNAGFSDKFIAEIANLNIAAYEPPPLGDGEELIELDPPDPLTELLAHNSLASLWSLLITEAGRTFYPASKSNISPLLVAEFRTAASRRAREEDFDDEEAGQVLGQRCFPYDAVLIDKYLRSEMAWWKGERPTVGVEIEEAFKCRICEFAEACSWRTTKVEEGLQKMRLRREARARSEV